MNGLRGHGLYRILQLHNECHQQVSWPLDLPGEARDLRLKEGNKDNSQETKTSIAWSLFGYWDSKLLFLLFYSGYCFSPLKVTGKTRITESGLTFSVPADMHVFSPSLCLLPSLAI